MCSPPLVPPALAGCAGLRLGPLDQKEPQLTLKPTPIGELTDLPET